MLMVHGGPRLAVWPVATRADVLTNPHVENQTFR